LLAREVTRDQGRNWLRGRRDKKTSFSSRKQREARDTQTVGVVEKRGPGPQAIENWGWGGGHMREKWEKTRFKTIRTQRSSEQQGGEKDNRRKHAVPKGHGGETGIM